MNGAVSVFIEYRYPETCANFPSVRAPHYAECPLDDLVSSDLARFNSDRLDDDELATGRKKVIRSALSALQRNRVVNKLHGLIRDLSSLRE